VFPEEARPLCSIPNLARMLPRVCGADFFHITLHGKNSLFHTPLRRDSMWSSSKQHFSSWMPLTSCC
jgi:hypothetical protein